MDNSNLRKRALRKLVVIALVLIIAIGTLGGCSTVAPENSDELLLAHPSLPCMPSTGSGEAGDTLWHPIGPFGGSIYAIAIDPTNYDRVYVGTYGAGLFKSEDGGESWEPINEGLGDNRVTAITLDPVKPTTIYAGTDERGVFKSVDGGHHWVEINQGFKEHWNQFVRQIVVDSTNPEMLYMSGNGVYKSLNGGKSWTLVSEEYLDSGFVHLATNPGNLDVMYAGTRMGGVFKTEDGGASWAEVNNGLTYSAVNDIAIDPSRPATVYAVNRDGVFKSTNGGRNWTRLHADSCDAVALNPTDPKVIYAGTHFTGVLKSEDGGLNWEPAGTALSHMQVNVLTIDPSRPHIVYAGTHHHGLFKSSDGGSHWAPCNTGLVNTLVKPIAIDPADPSILYVGTFGNGLFKTIDGGESWTTVNDGLTNRYIKSILITPDSRSTVYAGTCDGVFKSDDAGCHWEEASQGLTDRRVTALAIDPRHSTVLYAGTYGGGIFKSNDAGASWVPSNHGLTILYVESLVINPADPSVLYAGTYGGVFKSIDGGDSWCDASDGLRNKNVSSLALNPSSLTLYASTADGIYQSTDDTETWHAITDSLNSNYYRSVVLASSNDKIIFAASWNGVFMTWNGGDSWVSLQNGMVNIQVISLAMHPSDPDTLYAGTYGGGTYVISLACHGIWGQVTDAVTHQPIGYAQVSTDHGGYSTRADIDGYFILPYVAEGSYVLTTEAFGYEPSSSATVQAEATEWIQVDLYLSPGGRFVSESEQEQGKCHTAIITPWLDSQFVLGEDTLLVGKIALAETMLQSLTAEWSSNLSGGLGTSTVDSNGTTSIIVRILQVGEHIITLKIADQDGIVGIARTNIHVREAQSTHAIGFAWDETYMWAVTETGTSRQAPIFKLDISDRPTIVDIYDQPSPCPTWISEEQP